MKRAIFNPDIAGISRVVVGHQKLPGAGLDQVARAGQDAIAKAELHATAHVELSIVREDQLAGTIVQAVADVRAGRLHVDHRQIGRVIASRAGIHGDIIVSHGNVKTTA